MDTTYVFAKSQTLGAVERFTKDAFLKLKCKPGYVQRGAVCQPDRGLKANAIGVLKGALAGAGIGAVGAGVDRALAGRQKQLKEMYSITGDAEETKQREKNQKLFDNLRLGGEIGRGLAAAGAGGYLAGGGIGRRLAGATAGFLASEAVQALSDRLGREKEEPQEAGLLPQRGQSNTVRRQQGNTAQSLSTNPTESSRGGALARTEREELRVRDTREIPRALPSRSQRALPSRSQRALPGR